MNPAFINDMSWAMSEVYASVTDQLLVNLARHFPYVNDRSVHKSFEYQAQMLAQMGQVNRESVNIIMRNLGSADEALRKCLESAIVDALRKEDPKLAEAARRGLLTAPVNPQATPGMMQAFKAYYAQSADKLNLVNTVMLESTQAAYAATVSDIGTRIATTQSILNTSTGQVVSGVTAYNTAVRDAVKKMVSNGLTGFVDHAGRRWSPEAYVAMDIKTTMMNTARAAVFERNAEYGNDLYQVSTHNGARPLCYPWQGKILSTSGRTGTTEDLDGTKIPIHSESEVESFRYGGGLFGVNCGHYPMIFIPGLSTLKGDPQSPEDNEKTYEESQEQRRLERRLREEKRELDIMKAQGASPEAIQAQREKVRQASADIDDFCEKTGRTRKRNREGTPVRATWPDPNTYDPVAFPTKERDKMRDWFANGTPVQAAEPAKPTFTPAKTRAEAEEYAKSIGISADYSRFDISVANAVNGTMQTIRDEFGESALSAIQSVGSFPKGYSTRWAGVYSPTKHSLWLRNVNGGSALSKMGSIATEQKKIGYWSTGSELHVIRHEMGHAIADSLSGKIDIAKINAYRDEVKTKILRSRGKILSEDVLSEYGMTNTNEFIAESFAEYLNGNPRETARTVVEMIKGMIK